MIRVDVSEIKTLRECSRKHQLSSRNRFHLRPKIPNENLIFGTQFHEVLAMMYLDVSLDKILEWINQEVKNSVLWKTMDTMTKGYYEGPYQQDKERYVVIDVEKSFCYPIAAKYAPQGAKLTFFNDNNEWFAKDEKGVIYEAICACGSIDMICIDAREQQLVGFEHKTTKNFRPAIYNLVDEQPRLYFWALKNILDEYHMQGAYLEVKDVGPIYLNQVKKLQTKFDYDRIECYYEEEDINNFMQSFIKSAMSIATNAHDISPVPGYMKCSMCDYSDICMHYGYCDIRLDKLLDEFEGEFEVREHDHLEEKAQRHNPEV